MSSPEDRKRAIPPETIREALKLPDEFICHDARVGVTWALGPTLTTRDSGFAAEANAEALLQFLEGYAEIKGQWYILGATHWGFGWVEQIAFQVFEGAPEDMVPSRVFELLLGWKECLQHDPIADHQLYEEKRREEALSRIRWAHGISVKATAHDGWAEDVYERLDPRGKIHEADGELYIASEDINAVLKELGIYDDED